MPGYRHRLIGPGPLWARSWAAAAFYNLTLSEFCCNRILDVQDTISSLVCLLAVDGPVALKAAGALRNLAMFAAPRGPMVEAGAVRPLAAMLSHESDEVRSVAAAALCNLAKSEVLQTQIMEAWALALLVAILPADGEGAAPRMRATLQESVVSHNPVMDKIAAELMSGALRKQADAHAAITEDVHEMTKMCLSAGCTIDV